MLRQIIRGSILTFLLACFATTSYSQSPGYLGKKFLINVGGSFYPALLGPTTNMKGEQSSSFDETFQEYSLGLNYAFEFGVEYALKRYGSVGIYNERYKTGMVSRLDILRDNGRADRQTSFHIIQANAIGAYYSRYKVSKGALAPIGRYTSLGLETVNTKGTIIDSINVNQIPIGIFGLEPFVQQKRLYNFVGKYMISIPLSDRLLLRTGGSIRLPLTLIKDFSTSFVLADQTMGATQAEYDYKVSSRIARHGALRFEIGLGLLLF